MTLQSCKHAVLVVKTVDASRAMLEASFSSKISDVCSVIIEGDRFRLRIPHRDAAQSQSRQQHLRVDGSGIHRQALDAMEGVHDFG